MCGNIRLSPIAHLIRSIPDKVVGSSGRWPASTSAANGPGAAKGMTNLPLTSPDECLVFWTVMFPEAAGVLEADFDKIIFPGGARGGSMSEPPLPGGVTGVALGVNC